MLNKLSSFHFKLFALLFFLIQFSNANSQTAAHPKILLDKSDLFYSIDEYRVSILSKIFEASAKGDISVYLDSGLKRSTSAEYFLSSSFGSQTVIAQDPAFPNDPTKTIDTTLLIPFDSYFASAQLRKNFLHYKIKEGLIFYFKRTDLENKVNEKEKSMLLLCEEFLQGNIEQESLKKFSRSSFFKLQTKLYNLGKDSILTAYEQVELKDIYTKNQSKEIGSYRKYYSIPSTVNPSGSIQKDSMVPMTSEQVNGISIYFDMVSTNNTDFTFAPRSICPLYNPIIGGIELSKQALFHLRFTEIPSALNKNELFLINTMADYTLRRTINPNNYNDPADFND